MPCIQPAKFSHVVYRTRRFEEMLRWYKTVFHARVQHQGTGLAFLTYDDEHHRMAFINLAVLQPGRTETEKQGLIGVDHVAYTYGSLNLLLEHYERLRAEDIRPYWCIHHGVTVSMYYADPDGNQMEFQIDVYESIEDANAFMSGPGFSGNPIGVEFDPEEWLARIGAGASPSEFLERRVHEPISPVRGAMER